LAERGAVTVKPITHVEFPVDNDVFGFPRAFVLFALLVGIVAVVSGYPVVAPMTIVALLVVAAAVVDEQVGRIPNRLTFVALATVMVAVPFVATQSRPLGSVAFSVVAGILISGAPVLLLIWLLRPDLIGGGDWKLLAVLGASLGLIAPIAAALAAFVACLVQFVRLVLGQRRSIPFAPSLAVGYAIALATIPLLTSATGGAL
jgi:leader peptidase (prepilin peptidase)/N-methyltransferase